MLTHCVDLPILAPTTLGYPLARRLSHGEVADEDQLELKPGTRLNAFELLVRIGQGGMAAVWVARGRVSPDQPERLVAIKAMLPQLAGSIEFRQLFLDEGRTVQSIDHPNVVKVYEVSECDGVLYMVMEWVEGESLHGIIAEANKRRPIPSEIAVRVIADTAAGLHAAHEVRGWDGNLKHLVHCDVSPHNILISLDGTVKLVDFGVASAVDQVGHGEDKKIRGKFGYMSPEQAQAKQLDRRSDLFSLGIVLFELTTGYRLFRGRDDRHTLELVKWGKIPRPGQIDNKYPTQLAEILAHALEREVESRFQSANDFRDALEGYLVDQRIMVPTAGVAGLVTRVLGKKGKQRRDAIRSAIKELDGHTSPNTPLVSDEPVAQAEASGSVSRSVSMAEVPSDTGIGAARLPSDYASSSQMMQQTGASRPTPIMAVALAGLLGALLATGIVLYVLRSGGSNDIAVDVAAATPSAVAPPAAKPKPAEPTGPQGLNLSDLPVLRLDTPSDLPSADDPGPEVSPQKRSPRRSPRPKGKTSKPKPSPAPGVKQVQLAKNPEVKLEADPPKRDGQFDRAATRAALNNASMQARLCRRPGGTTGRGTVNITVMPSGRILKVSAQGKFAGTPVGHCVEAKFSRARVPAYRGSAIVLAKTFKVPD